MIYKFEAVIKKHEGKDATYIEVPLDVEKEFGAKRVKIIASFDGVQYRGSIVKMGLPCYMIGITKEIRKQIEKDAGDTIQIELQKDEEIREIHLPEDFQTELYRNKAALDFYQALSYSTQRKYYQWITGAKKAETREKRIAEAVHKLANQIKI